MLKPGFTTNSNNNSNATLTNSRRPLPTPKELTVPTPLETPQPIQAESTQQTISLSALHNEPGATFPQIIIQSVATPDSTSTVSSESIQANTSFSLPPQRDLPSLPPNIPPRPAQSAPLNSPPQRLTNSTNSITTIETQPVDPWTPFFGTALVITAPFANTLYEFTNQYRKDTVKLGLLHPSTATIVLLEKMPVAEFNQELASIQVISELPIPLANEVAFNRDVYHMPPHRSSEDDNLAMLGTAGSATRLGGGGNSPFIKANAQVSILFLTTMRLNEDQSHKNERGTVRLHVLSVSAPALDDKTIIFTLDDNGQPKPETIGLKSQARPEMETYLDTSVVPPIFNTENFQIAHNTLGKHILMGVQLCGPKRVVLCAFGMNNFLSALNVIDEQTTGKTNYKEQAFNIAARSLANTIKQLQDQGIVVCFSDRAAYFTERFDAQTYWDKVNSYLELVNGKPLGPVNNTKSALGEGWAQSTDMIVNAGDPDALIGDELLLGRSFDSILGSMITGNAIHWAACNLYQRDRKKSESISNLRSSSTSATSSLNRSQTNTSPLNNSTLTSSSTTIGIIDSPKLSQQPTPIYEYDEVKSKLAQSSANLPFLPQRRSLTFDPTPVKTATLIETNSTTQLNRPSRPSRNAPQNLPVRKPSLAEPSKVNSGPSVNAPFAYQHNKFLATYLKQMYQLVLLTEDTPAVILLKEQTPFQFQQELDSIHIISNLKPEYANTVAFNVDVFHTSDDNKISSSEFNQAVLNTKGSAIRLSEGLSQQAFIQPNAQVSQLQLTTMKQRNIGNVQLHALFVPVPVLDDYSAFHVDQDGKITQDAEGLKSAARPEMATYIDTSTTPPRFSYTQFKIAHETVGEHILKAVKICEPKRVVLTSLSINLDALEKIDINTQQHGSFGKTTHYKTQAIDIAARSLANTIKELRGQGKDVCFSDVPDEKSQKLFSAQGFWDRVDHQLKGLNEKPLAHVNGINSGFGMGWAKSTDLIVLATDAGSLIGNGMLSGRTPASSFACVTTANAVQVEACNQHNL